MRLFDAVPDESGGGREGGRAVSETVNWEARRWFCQHRIDRQVHARAELYCIEAIDALLATEKALEFMKLVFGPQLQSFVERFNNATPEELDAMRRDAAK